MQSTATVKHCPVCGKEYAEGDICSDDGATLIGNAAAPDPLVGQVLKGTYKIIERIAQGGMGIVYRASQISLGRTVAIKAIYANPLLASELVQRFFREARLLSQVNHPNVVSLIDFGNTETGIIYMVMEYLTGRTLDKVIPREKGLPVDMALDLMEQICAGVAAAHRNSMVHRDLKPSNIFLANLSGDSIMVKLLDFGIAKTVNDKQGGLTQDGAMIGSSGYMSPEQITGSSDIDARTDIYALGGLLYFMLAGQPAYRGNTTRTILTKQLASPPDPIDFDKLGKPDARAIMPVILTAMDPDPNRRYQSAPEFIHALRSAVGAPEAPPQSRLPSQVLLPEESAASRSTVVPSLAGTTTKTDQVNEPMAHPPETPSTAVRPALDPRTKTYFLIGGTIGLALLVYIAYLLVLQLSRDPAKNAGAPVAEAKNTDKNKAHPPSKQQGVTENEILLGMSAAFSGPSKELGRGMKLGIETFYRQLNENGGIEGRKVHLVALDDGYEPTRALPNMKELYEQHKVFAVIGNVGTPTAQVTVPYALDKNLPFFGAFTGAGLLRKDPPDRYVFNYRASYAEETAAMVKYLVEIKKVQPDQIAVFAQSDTYGDAGFNGVVKAMRKYSRDKDDILRVGYARNTVEIDEAVGEVLKQRDKIKAIVMVPTYRPAALFIKKIRENGMHPIFHCVSFVGSEALAEELKEKCPQFAEGVIVTQVVPHYESRSTAVLKYRAALKKYFPDEQPSFISLEGYIAASLLAEGMQKASDNLTTETLVDALETIKDLDLGIGAKISYGPSEHQGSHKVWGAILDKTARYQILDLE